MNETRDLLPDRDDTDDAWPTCPECGQRRQTRCQICRVAGTDFPAADYQAIPLTSPSTQPPTQPPACGCGPDGGCQGADAEPEPTDDVGQLLPLLLRCDTCDEIFEPRYYRVCAWCGFDFGAGIVAEMPLGEPLNARTKLVLAGVGLFFLAALAYWIYLMSG